MVDLPLLTLFLALTGMVVAISWPALRARQVYGVYRMLAFEAMVLLFALNVGRWFEYPLAAHQVISWTLLIGSLGLAVHGAHLLRTVGQSQERVIEETRTVVEVGAYRYIRHPLYASLLLLGWGMFFKGIDWPGLILAGAATIFLFATARCEERFNLERLGDAYRVYMGRTRMFIPFVL